MSSELSKRPVTIYGAATANLIIAVAKFVAAAFTGSSAMLAEGIHSVADTGNQMLLLFGLKRSRQPADKQHPFGHGQEFYFWSLIVAIVLFGIGGGMSLYEGISHLHHPHAVTDPVWNYLVLGVGVLAEGTSWAIALRHLLKEREPEESVWYALHDSKNPAVFVVIAEDTAALIGLIVAGLGIFLSRQLNYPILDSFASIIIGLMLCGVALFLAYESRGLLIGETAGKAIVQSVLEMLEKDTAVKHAQRPLTMQLGPHEVLLSASVTFEKNLTASEIQSAIIHLEQRIREQHHTVKHIFIGIG